LIQIADPDTPSKPAKQEKFMRSVFHTSGAYELSAQVGQTPYGLHLQLISFVPTARMPREQVQFQGVFSKLEILLLRNALDAALEGTP
jgi:hypothetical protein